MLLGSGATPSAVNGHLKRAFVEAKTRSERPRIVVLEAETVDCEDQRLREVDQGAAEAGEAVLARDRCRWRAGPSDRSWPAEKESSPVRTTTATPGSSAAAKNASVVPSHISVFIAFLASGRWNVMVRTRPSSTMSIIRIALRR